MTSSLHLHRDLTQKPDGPNIKGPQSAVLALSFYDCWSQIWIFFFLARKKEKKRDVKRQESGKAKREEMNVKSSPEHLKPVNHHNHRGRIIPQDPLALPTGFTQVNN